MTAPTEWFESFRIAAAILLAALVSLPATSLLAEPVVVVRGWKKLPTQLDLRDLVELTSLYRSGDWTQLQARSRAMVAELEFAPSAAGGKKHRVRVSENTYQLMFVARGPGEPAEIISYVVQDPLPTPYSDSLPGLSRARPLRVLLLTPFEDARLSLSVQNTGTPSPLIAQAGKVAQELAKVGPFFFREGVAGGPEATLSAVARPPARRPLTAELLLVRPLHNRGSLAMRASLSLPAAERHGFLASNAADDDLAFLRKQIERGAGLSDSDSSCRIAVARDLEAAARTALNPSPNLCATQSMFGECLAAARKALPVVVTSAACLDRAGPAVLQAILSDLDRFQQLLSPDLGAVSKESTYTYSARTWVSFGAVAATFVGGKATPPRVQQDDGLIAAKPISGALAGPAVFFHPFSDRPGSMSTPLESRVRLFGGLALSPEFGFTAGIAVNAIGGASIIAGRTWLFVDSTRDGDRIGAPPSNPEEPFQRRWADAWFLGLAFSY